MSSTDERPAPPAPNGRTRTEIRTELIEALYGVGGLAPAILALFDEATVGAAPATPAEQDGEIDQLIEEVVRCAGQYFLTAGKRRKPLYPALVDAKAALRSYVAEIHAAPAAQIDAGMRRFQDFFAGWDAGQALREAFWAGAQYYALEPLDDDIVLAEAWRRYPAGAAPVIPSTRDSGNNLAEVRTPDRWIWRRRRDGLPGSVFHMTREAALRTVDTEAASEWELTPVYFGSPAAQPSPLGCPVCFAEQTDFGPLCATHEAEAERHAAEAVTILKAERAEAQPERQQGEPMDLPYPPDDGRTHWEGCERVPGHHNCAVLVMDALRAELDERCAAQQPDALREALKKWLKQHGRPLAHDQTACLCAACESLRAALAGAPAVPVQPDTQECKWAADESGVWSTGCGNAFEFNAGGPGDNRMRFCGYCGGRLVEVPYTEPAAAQPQEEA